ncbi:hypothetical protein MPL1032_50096 [Mesorhizobium plurifarium]|uniref:Uncharacterized protein n=1 Tax=Mesorhizobium plurifarium TaxID=69974 RepID=A0A0K2W5W9_MESPL|nr:hypothetical protein MPL1032_50096 [Mesorhizobium plurifarium]
MTGGLSKGPAGRALAHRMVRCIGAEKGILLRAWRVPEAAVSGVIRKVGRPVGQPANQLANRVPDCRGLSGAAHGRSWGRIAGCSLG